MGIGKGYLLVLGAAVAVLAVSSIFALRIDVSVNDNLGVQITSLNYDSISDRPVRINLETYNSGSIGYTARVRIDVMNGSSLVSSLWSREYALTPGDRKTADIYWFLPEAGNFTFVPKIYYANEIFAGETYPLQIIPQQTTDVFSVKDFRVYDDYIRFLVKSNGTVRDTVFLPVSYTKGWIFGQARLAYLDGNWTEVAIPYKPALWTDGQKMTLLTVSEDGRSLSEKQFDLVLETGVQKYVDMLLDRVDVFFK